MEWRRKIYLDSEIPKKQYQKFLPSQLPFFIQIKFLKSDSTFVLITRPEIYFPAHLCRKLQESACKREVRS